MDDLANSYVHPDLDSDEVANGLTGRLRGLGPCYAVVDETYVGINESQESPGFFDLQTVNSRALTFMKRPCGAALLRYIVQRETGRNIHELVLKPCESLMFDPLTGFPDRDERDAAVYFIQSAVDGPIKIGRAVDVNRRLRDLQTGSAAKLELLAAIRGPWHLERWLHGILAAHRLDGEWFQNCWEVREAMRALLRRYRGA